jgi:hypothetical protein
MKYAPHEYQCRAILWLVGHPEAALFMEPGLGKSSVTLRAFQALREAKAAKKLLVIAPLRVAQLVWSAQGELGKWDEFRDLRAALLHGSNKSAALKSDADLYVINFDGLQWLIESGGLLDLVRRGVDTLCVDELSKFKHPNTKRFKLIKQHLGRFRRRWGLTGTPVANGIMDLFGQVYVLDLGRSLGRFITHYRHTFFDATGYGGYTWVPKPGAAKQIYGILAGRCCYACGKAVGKDGHCRKCRCKVDGLALSLRAADCLDLPQLVENDILVDLPAAARATYEEMERELLTVIRSETVTAANTAVALNKCRQVTGGGIYHDGRVLEIHSAKIDALVDLVEELQGQPLLVLYEFTHELDRLRAALQQEVPAINGKTTATAVASLVQQWNAGRLPLLAGHPAAMGHGLNLQGCAGHVCWFNLTWDFELYDQAIRRVWRQGQRAARVIVHRILARNTVDMVVLRALEHKSQGQAALFAALREHAATKGLRA